MRSFVVEEPRSRSLRALNYEPAMERMRRARSSSSMRLRSLASAFGESYGTMFTRIDCAETHGVRLLSQTDTFELEPSGRVIRRDSMPHPAKHEIRCWQVLVSGAGQMGEGNLFGRSVLADRRLEGGFVGPDTFVVEFLEPGSDLSLWTYAFLNTSVGIAGVQSSAYGTSIPHLRADLLGDLPVPIATSSTISRVAGHIRQAIVCREKYVDDLRAARAIIEADEVAASAGSMCARRHRRTILWADPLLPTLSGWNYASTGGALGYLSSKWNGRLRDVVEKDGIYRGGRGPRISCKPPHGVDFLSQRAAFQIRPIPQRVLLPSTGLIPRAGTIMVGGQGTLGEGELFGRATIVPPQGAKCAWTEHLLRVVPKVGKEGALFAYLTTTVGFRLLRSTAVGTKLLSLRPDLLLDLPVPDLAATKSSRLEQLVRSSLDARARADSSESEAIRIIEQEVLPEWLA